jgi:hypothetical protein
MYAVFQIGSRTLRSASATKRRVCWPFWARTDGAPSVMAAAVAAAPRTICRRLMLPDLAMVVPPGRAPYTELEWDAGARAAEAEPGGRSNQAGSAKSAYGTSETFGDDGRESALGADPDIERTLPKGRV